MGRTWKWILGIAAALIIAGVLVVAIFTVRFMGAGRAVDVEIARIRAEGGPTTAADLAGKPIPDSENAALVYQKCFAYLPKSLDSPDRHRLRDFLNSDKRSAEPKLWARAKTIVDRYTPALSLAEKAAAMPKCRFKVDWSDLNSRAYHPAFLRFLAHLVAARGLLDAKSGNAPGAVKSVELIIRLSNSLKDELDLSSLMVRSSIIETAGKAMVDVSKQAGITESDARRLNAVFAGVDLRRDLAKAMRGERAQGIVFYDSVREGKMVSGQSQNGFRISPSRLFLDSDEDYYLDKMRDGIRVASHPYREQARVRRKRHRDPPRYAICSNLLLSFNMGEWLAQDRAIASIAGSRIFLGLLAYRDRFGSYPPGLADLKKINWRLPEDPFSGKPFVYHRKGSGFVLYSIGDDLKDNGGVERNGDRPGDIVWELDK